MGFTTCASRLRNALTALPLLPPPYLSPRPAVQDPVIQIANVVTLQGSKSAIVRNVFTLGTCTPIAGAQVLPHEKEEDLLDRWAAFVREVDPDIITGYNVQNFDIPYLLNRCKKLKCDGAQILGRIRGAKATMRDTTFSSSAHGKSENVETQIDGRVIFDLLQYMRREHKLSSYSLNSVSAHFLKEQKEDVHHSVISDLQKGTPDDRHRLAVYCLKDAFLPQRLMDKLMVLINHIEMARVTGVPLDFLLTRGQQIKVVSMLYRKCAPMGLLVPTLQRAAGAGGEGEETFEGAIVIEPMKGYYDVPIATLDFASLYPSIMMAHNLCYRWVPRRRTGGAAHAHTVLHVVVRPALSPVLPPPVPTSRPSQHPRRPRGHPRRPPAQGGVREDAGRERLLRPGKHAKGRPPPHSRGAARGQEAVSVCPLSCASLDPLTSARVSCRPRPGPPACATSPVLPLHPPSSRAQSQEGHGVL